MRENNFWLLAVCIVAIAVAVSAVPYNGNYGYQKPRYNGTNYNSGYVNNNVGSRPRNNTYYPNYNNAKYPSSGYNGRYNRSAIYPNNNGSGNRPYNTNYPYYDNTRNQNTGYAVNNAYARDIHFGGRQYSDHSTIFGVKKNTWFSNNFEQTFYAPSGENITFVQVIDQVPQGKGGFVKYVAGGPGYNFIRLGFQGSRLDFRVIVYSKRGTVYSYIYK